MKPFDLTRFDLNLLVVLEALLLERHVGRTAERLNLSQSATSHALSRLRETLDDPLFVRNPKGIEPTPRALSLAPAVAEILEGVRRIATPRGPFDPARMHREFVVGTTDYGMLTVLAPAISVISSTSVDDRVPLTRIIVLRRPACSPRIAYDVEDLRRLCLGQAKAIGRVNSA